MTALQEVVPSPWDTDWVNVASNAAHDALAAALEPLPGWDDGMSRPATTAFSGRRFWVPCM